MGELARTDYLTDRKSQAARVAVSDHTTVEYAKESSDERHGMEWPWSLL